MARRRRKGNEAFSLFAFQDIITAVTGIVVLITLLLAVELMERVEATPTNDTATQVKQTVDSIEDLKKQIAKLEREIESKSNAINELPTTDIELLKSMLARSAESVKALDKKILTESADLVAKQKKLDELEEETDQEKEAEEEELEELRKEVDELEKKIKSLNKGGRRLFKTGNEDKKTWLVEIFGQGFRVAPIGESRKPRTFSDSGQFLRWANGLNSTTDNIYAFVRPKGQPDFLVVFKKLVDSPIEFGFTCIGLSDQVLDDETGAGL